MNDKLFSKRINIPISKEMYEEIASVVRAMQEVQPGLNKAIWARAVLLQELRRRRKTKRKTGYAG